MLSLLAAAAVSASAAVRCPRMRTFAETVAITMRGGEQVVREELFDQIIDVPAPALSSAIDAADAPDGISHFFDVLVYKKDGKLLPKAVLVSSMRDEGRRRERWLMLTDLSGNLKKAVVAWDELDENGNMKPGGKGTISQQKGPYNPDALEHLRYELSVDCVATRKSNHG